MANHIDIFWWKYHLKFKHFFQFRQSKYIQHDDNLDFHLIFISYFIFLWFISEYMNHMMLQKMIKYNISNTWNKDMIYYRYALEKIIKFWISAKENIFEISLTQWFTMILTKGYSKHLETELLKNTHNALPCNKYVEDCKKMQLSPLDAFWWLRKLPTLFWLSTILVHSGQWFHIR